MTPTRTYLPNYLHFGKDLGFDRVCVFTRTVLGPGFPAVRVGLHLVLVAIQITSLRRLVAHRLCFSGRLTAKGLFGATKKMGATSFYPFPFNAANRGEARSAESLAAWPC